MNTRVAKGLRARASSSGSAVAAPHKLEGKSDVFCDRATHMHTFAPYKGLFICDSFIPQRSWALHCTEGHVLVLGRGPKTELRNQSGLLSQLQNSSRVFIFYALGDIPKSSAEAKVSFFSSPHEAVAGTQQELDQVASVRCSVISTRILLGRTGPKPLREMLMDESCSNR